MSIADTSVLEGDAGSNNLNLTVSLSGGSAQPVTVEGTLTLTDRTDYNIVCFRFIRYGGDDVNEVFVCGTLDGDRFSVPVTFTDRQRGTYTIEPFAFWSDSGPQTARSRYGVIVVE